MEQDRASGAHPEGHPLFAPGLKWRSRIGGEIPMWIPPGSAVKAGYIPKSLMLDRNASQLEIAEVCRKQWQDLEDWRSGKRKPVKQTISWLIDRYLGDTTSPFQRVKPDTQQSYRWECKRIRETVGDMRLDPKLEGGVLVARRTGEDFLRWFHNWGHPPGKKPTPSRATHCIAMLRTLIGYYVTIGGGPGAAQLRDILSEMQFDKPAARSQTITREQVNAIVNKADELGFRSIAIATLAQYELIERRAHIIGQWYGDSWGDGWLSATALYRTQADGKTRKCQGVIGAISSGTRRTWLNDAKPRATGHEQCGDAQRNEFEERRGTTFATTAGLPG